jgi:hypothetical protein
MRKFLFLFFLFAVSAIAASAQTPNPIPGPNKPPTPPPEIPYILHVTTREVLVDVIAVNSAISRSST